MKVVFCFRSGAGFYQDYKTKNMCATYISTHHIGASMSGRSVRSFVRSVDRLVAHSRIHAHKHSGKKETRTHMQAHIHLSYARLRSIHPFRHGMKKNTTKQKRLTRCKHMVNDTYTYGNQPIYVALCIQKPNWLTLIWLLSAVHNEAVNLTITTIKKYTSFFS